MTRARGIFLAVGGLVIITVIILSVLVFCAPSIQRSFFYPKPRNLPPIVNQTTEQLLARLQAVLDTNAPIVATALQPGLSDAEIATLEAGGGFHLSDELRALYRWHNGMATNSVIGLLAGQRFVPLDEIVRERAIIAQQVASASGIQRAAFSIFAGHRTSWIQVLDDGAGDGYFYDPQRSAAEGAFFFNLAEGRYYRWFPSVRNFLAGGVECYESRAVTIGSDGKSLDEQSDRTEKIWERFGRGSE